VSRPCLLPGATDILRVAGWPRFWSPGAGILLVAIREEMLMTGETICELLQPLIGKSGSVFMVVSRVGQIGFATTENHKLTGVELRPDGLVRLEREAGWTVLDPGEVMAVAWNGDQEHSAGQFL
jgi:hypothetical protein